MPGERPAGRRFTDVVKREIAEREEMTRRALSMHGGVNERPKIDARSEKENDSRPAYDPPKTAPHPPVQLEQRAPDQVPVGKIHGNQS